MREKLSDCLSIGRDETDGKVVISREMQVVIGSITHRIIVGTQAYAEAVARQNATLSEDARIPSNILILENVTDPTSVCKQLASMGVETLTPYLTVHQVSN